MMIEVIPSWWVFLMAAGLLGLLILLDFKSRSSRWRLFRIIAFVLIVLSFLGLYMKPFFLLDGEKMKVALLTESHVSIDTDSLERDGFEVIDPDTYFKLAGNKNITEMIVLGDGLEAWELRLKHEFDYLPPKHMIEGPLETGKVEAVTNTLAMLTFRILVNEPMDIHLSGTGIEGAVKSMVPEEQQVTFEVNPKVAGNLTYELYGVREGDTLFSELVPMKISERVGFNTLILTASPSFELRFLKNLLKEEGYGVAERLQITKGTFRESFSNLERRSLTRLTKTMLEDFKVVITDKESYDQLSHNEKQNVNDALRKGSIGVIWMDDASNDWLKTKPLKEQTVEFKSNQQTVELKTRGVISTGHDLQVKYQGNTVGHLHTYGLGKVMLPFLQSTYQLKLKGFDDLYSEMWNALMRPVTGVNNLPAKVKVSDFPRVDEPIAFTFRSSEEEPVYLDSVRLSIKEKWHQPGVFTAMLWPKERGWNTLKIGDTHHSFFVFDQIDWQAQKIYQKRLQTAAFAKKSRTIESEVSEAEQPVSKWIFFTMILVSLSFLWIEQRVN